MRFIGVLDEKGEFIQLNTQAIKTFYTTVDVERALEIPTDPIGCGCSEYCSCRWF